MMNAGTPREVHSGGDGRPDIDLMWLVARDEREAFATLVRRHQVPLLNFFRRLGADSHGAEDCAQETFLRLFRFRVRYHPTAPFSAFLYTLARHAWVDWSRRTARRSNVPIENAMIIPERSRCSMDDRIDLEAALRRLPEHLRWVVVLSADRGLSYAEIGSVLGIPIGTVKSRMFHAIRRLREELHVPTAR